MKADFLSQALVRALAPISVAQCSLSSKYGSANGSLSLFGGPLALSSGNSNLYSQLPSDVPVPASSDPSAAPGNAPNPNAKRPKFTTNNQIRIRRDVTGGSPLEPAEQCAQPGPWSCSDEAEQASTCCVQKPGGVLLHVQLWDEGIGLPDSWGIHGLWPDLCNGGYDESNDGDGRAYSASDIESAISSSGTGGQSLLDFMNSVWLSDDESPSAFWAHEWKSHGVRVSTLDPSCFSNYQTAQEVPIYFETVVNLFRQLDTYKMLAAANIVPSSDATYALADLQSAVESASSYVPDFVCKSDTLSQVQYYLRAQGPVQDGRFTQSNPTRSSNCPDEGIKYPVKNVGAGGSGGGGGQDEERRGGGEGEGEPEGHRRRHHHERRDDDE